MVRDLWPDWIEPMVQALLDVLRDCAAVTTAIALLPSEAWANRIVYILERLDAMRKPDATLDKDEILQRVRDAIDIRLSAGHW